MCVVCACASLLSSGVGSPVTFCSWKERAISGVPLALINTDVIRFGKAFFNCFYENLSFSKVRASHIKLSKIYRNNELYKILLGSLPLSRINSWFITFEGGEADDGTCLIAFRDFIIK